jgi:hypothetical protein
MTTGEEAIKGFVRKKLAPAGLAAPFCAAMVSLARSQSRSVSMDLESRQRDALNGSIEILFRIVDWTEEALNPQSGTPKPEAEGGFR